METTSQNQLLRLKIASEMVLGNQAAVAFSRAFYLEDLLIERVLKEFHELYQTCQALVEQVQKFTDEVLNELPSSQLSPITQSDIRCQCTDILESLGKSHQPSLENFQQQLIQAKARRQAKSCLLEKLSAQNSNISSQFNIMTLNELINDVHIPEFSCFINDSDFGVLEKLVEDWSEYRSCASNEFASYEKIVRGFQADVERNKKMREYTCDMILAQITQQKPLGACGADTLKKKGVFHKFSTLLRRHSHHNTSVSKEASPTPSQLSGVEINPNSNPFPQTF